MRFRATFIWFLRLLLPVVTLVPIWRSECAFACNLPICDIQSELKLLESKNQSFRFQYLTKLRQNFSKERNEPNLDNLVAFARDAIELIRRLNDEDYILREAKGLRDQSIFLLIQWVWRDCSRLSSGYAELANETQRYAALDFFSRKIETIKKETEIKELVCFAQRAETVSMSFNDSDYVAQRAVQLGAGLSTQLLEIVNGWEGLFQLTSLEGPLAQELENLRLILFSSGGEMGIVGSISHPTLRPMVFQKISFNERPQYLISRQSFASAVPSVMTLQFSEEFQEIRGTLLEPGELKKINFSAKRMLGIPSHSEDPCPENSILGRYETKLAEISGRFVIERIGPRQYAAIFVSGDNSLRLPFSFGRYNENTGRLTFLNMQTNTPLGWRLLAYRTADGQCKIDGWGLSTFNGAQYQLSMSKEKRD